MFEWMGFPLRVHRVESAQQALYELVSRADPAIHGWTESDCAEKVSYDKQPPSQGLSIDRWLLCADI